VNGKIFSSPRERFLTGRNTLPQTPVIAPHTEPLQTWPNACNNPCASQSPSNACQIGARVMQGKVQEEWIQMCEQAAIEQDSEKLMALITEINRMLDEKEQRVKSGKPAKAPFHR